MNREEKKFGNRHSSFTFLRLQILLLAIAIRFYLPCLRIYNITAYDLKLNIIYTTAKLFCA